MGDSDDDPFETYIGADGDDASDGAPAGSWSWPSGVFTRPVWAITAIVLATASLLGIAAGEILNEALTFDSGSLDKSSVAPAIQAGFAAAALGFGVLSLRSGDDETPAWSRAVGAAAIVVAVLSMLVNLAAVGADLTASNPSFVVGDSSSSAPSDIPIPSAFASFLPTDIPSGIFPTSP